VILLRTADDAILIHLSWCMAKLLTVVFFYSVYLGSLEFQAMES